jgi:hypothetical protein
VALVRQRIILTRRPQFVGEVSVNFCGYRGVGYSARRISYGSNLGFLDQSRCFSSKQLLSCTHETEWTQFQNHYFSENVVEPGIEPGPLDR